MQAQQDAVNPDPRPTVPNRYLLWACTALFVFVLIEGACALFLYVVISSQAHFLVWNPDLSAVQADWAAAAGKWDNELGWPPPAEAIAPPRDKTGAKANPDFPADARACASAYGDSFVWGDDIPLPDGWIEQMSRKLGCRVANYGVSGYGTDQAYYRFTQTRGDDAPVVMLGIFPENIIRNVNQYRQFIGFNQTPLVLKGRYVLTTSGQLEWIHRPRIDETGFAHLLRDPAKVIPHEYLLPDTRDGPVSLHFPYSLAVLRIALAPRLWTRIRGAPSWADFFRSDHPSHALALTTAIAAAFAQEAERRGQHSLVIMLPGASSFRARAENGVPEYQSLLDALSARHVAVFDPAPALIAALGQQSPCALYSQPSACNGHFGVSGSGLLADVVMAELKRRNWVK